MEEIEFLAEAAVVASFCLFQHVAGKPASSSFVSPGGTVDTLQHFVLAVTSPVSAGKFHQLVNSQRDRCSGRGVRGKGPSIVALTCTEKWFHRQG